MNNGNKVYEQDDDVILIESHVPVIVLDDSIVMDNNAAVMNENIEDGEINSNSESSSIELIDNDLVIENNECQVIINSSPSPTPNDVVDNNNQVEDIVDSIEEKTPIFSIVFNSKDVFDKWKTKLSAILYKKIDKIDIVESENNFTLSVSEANDNNMFMFDTQPKHDENIPKYSKTISCVINGEDNSLLTANDDKLCRNSTSMCFNCDGNHTLRDCTEPKNFNKIRKARQSFNTKNERYHVDIEQRFGHFLPGILSEDLRNALGLKKRQLPAHIYKMRVLGYPPGWLEEAKVKHSGISLFDSCGRKILESDEEDGEIDLQKDKYDIRKIHSFPGFNVEPEENYYDDSSFYCVPPMLAEHSKKIMIESLSGNTAQAYKKRKMKNLPTSSSSILEMNKSTLSTIDMDIDNEDIPIMPPGIEVDLSAPPLPLDSDESKEVPPPPPETPTKKLKETDIDENTNGNIRSDSPTLADLNQKKKELLSTLGDSSVFLETTDINSSVDDSLIYDILELDRSNTSTANDSNSSLNLTGNSSVQFKSIFKEQTPKSTFFGTPILKQVSPYTKLPSGDKFSVGVSDVINFENLPDSTGKYNQMKTVISKVRTIVQQINNEDL